MPRFDNECEFAKQPQGLYQLRVSQVVAHLPAFAGHPDQTAPAQTCEMVRDVGPALTHTIGEFSRVGRPLDKPHEYPASHTVGHSCADAPQNVELLIQTNSSCHPQSILHSLMYYTEG